MSGITGVNGNYGNVGLVDYLSQEAKEEDSILNTSTAMANADKMLSSAGKKSANSYYAQSASSSTGQAALKKALAALSAQGDGRVTFSDIEKYRQDLEKKLTATVRSGLTKAGLDPSVEFTLQMGTDGTVQVITNDPENKALIQKYLEANPKACEEFGYIQALSNLGRAKQAYSANSQQYISNVKAELQTSAVEAFFSNAMSSGNVNYASILASFNGGSQESVSFYTGIDYRV